MCLDLGRLDAVICSRLHVEISRCSLLVEVAGNTHRVINVHEFRVRIVAVGSQRTKTGEIAETHVPANVFLWTPGAEFAEPLVVIRARVEDGLRLRVSERTFENYGT